MKSDTFLKMLTNENIRTIEERTIKYKNDMTIEELKKDLEIRFWAYTKKEKLMKNMPRNYIAGQSGNIEGHLEEIQYILDLIDKGN